MLNIYVSSLAFLGKTIEEVIEIVKENDFALEFSSGMPFREDMEALFLNADISKVPHNYFPAPKVPFVLNLASSNSEIRDQSINHCINGLRLAKRGGADFFSAHAGFCIDPKPEELGQKIPYVPSFDKEVNKQLFLASLNIILEETEKLDMQFFVENNVIAGFNIIDGKNPLFCCEHSEITWMMQTINNDRLGLLLDTAHLKVSCQTLGLDVNNELKLLRRFVKAIHHSDNNGFVDDNQPIDSNYWFLRSLHWFKEIPHVIEVKKIDNNTIKDQIKLLQSYGC